MLINKKKIVQVDVKTLCLHTKTRDCNTITAIDAQGELVHEHDGYVPSFFPGEHHGDYLILDIDIETGKIVNWVPPTAEQLQEWMGDDDE